MKTVSFFNKTNVPSVVALGRFDGLHLGHQRIINSAKKLAVENNAQVVLFTIKKRPQAYSAILSFEELTEKAAKYGVNIVLYAQECEQFFSTDKDEFLKILFENHDVKGLSFGSDYTFGKDRGGTADYLADFCNRNGVPFAKEELLELDGEKVSSSLIKDLLSHGEVKKANELLGESYFTKGKVVHGRAVGRKLGFPTLNIVPDNVKMPIKEGVYKTCVVISDKRYKALTSVGTAPSFGKNELTTESFLLGFHEEVYDDIITVEYEDFIRDNYVFTDIEQLKRQITKDLKVYD